MKELKIDPKLAALFKPLEKEQLDELEEKLKAKYDGTPLYVWKGDIIVDGHNRYPIMKKYNIYFNVENVEDFLGEDCSRSDVMQWMISHQEARRNLSSGEKICAYSMMQEEIALENKEKMLEGNRLGAAVKHGNVVCVQMDAKQKVERDRSTNTREQIAKMAGVAAGTVARYDAIMKTDNEDLKKKVQTGEVKIGTAYREIKTRICKSCGKEKKIIDFFGNDTICKECARKEAEKNVNSLHMISTKPTEENMKVYEDVCTSRYAKDYVDQDEELSWLKDMCHDFIGQVNDRFFDLIGAIEKMDDEHIEEANNIIEDFVSDMFAVQKRFDEKKVSSDIMPEQIEEKTPKQQIAELDQKLESLDKNIESLQIERSNTVKKRGDLFKALDVKCPVKYKWIKEGQDLFPAWWKCQIYIDYDGLTEVLGEYHVSHSELPNTYMKTAVNGSREEISQKYHDDFRMIWKQAHDENVRLEMEANDKRTKTAQQLDYEMNRMKKYIPVGLDKNVCRKFYRTLANEYHPDNGKTGDAEMMQHVNELKAVWGI